jgi:hypothetical protein
VMGNENQKIPGSIPAQATFYNLYLKHLQKK